MTLNQIHEKLNGIEDAIVGGVKYTVKLPLWSKIIMGVLVVLLIILIITVFKSKGDVSQDYKAKMQTLDSVIKYQQKTIESLEKYADQQDTIIANLERDYSANRPKETKIIHQYEKIPDNINSLNREQLRREVSAY